MVKKGCVDCPHVESHSGKCDHPSAWFSCLHYDYDLNDDWKQHVKEVD